MTENQFIPSADSLSETLKDKIGIRYEKSLMLKLIPGRDKLRDIPREAFRGEKVKVFVVVGEKEKSIQLHDNWILSNAITSTPCKYKKVSFGQLVRNFPKKLTSLALTKKIPKGYSLEIDSPVLGYKIHLSSENRVELDDLANILVNEKVAKRPKENRNKGNFLSFDVGNIASSIGQSRRPDTKGSRWWDVKCDFWNEQYVVEWLKRIFHNNAIVKKDGYVSGDFVLFKILEEQYPKFFEFLGKRHPNISYIQHLEKFSIPENYESPKSPISSFLDDNLRDIIGTIRKEIAYIRKNDDRFDMARSKVWEKIFRDGGRAVNDVNDYMMRHRHLHNVDECKMMVSFIIVFGIDFSVFVGEKYDVWQNVDTALQDMYNRDPEMLKSPDSVRLGFQSVFKDEKMVEKIVTFVVNKMKSLTGSENLFYSARRLSFEIITTVHGVNIQWLSESAYEKYQVLREDENKEKITTLSREIATGRKLLDKKYVKELFENLASKEREINKLKGLKCGVDEWDFYSKVRSGELKRIVDQKIGSTDLSNVRLAVKMVLSRLIGHRPDFKVNTLMKFQGLIDGLYSPSFCKFGFVHASVLIKNLRIHWFSDSVTHVNDMKDDDGYRDIICSECETPIRASSRGEFTKIMEKLAKILVEFNTEIEYESYKIGKIDPKKKNCQEFTIDVLKTLGVYNFHPDVISFFDNGVKGIGGYHLYSFNSTASEEHKKFAEACVEMLVFHCEGTNQMNEDIRVLPPVINFNTKEHIDRFMKNVKGRFGDGTKRDHSRVWNELDKQVHLFRDKEFKMELTFDQGFFERYRMAFQGQILLKENLVIFEDHTKLSKFVKECLEISQRIENSPFSVAHPGKYALLKGFDRAMHLGERKGNKEIQNNNDCQFAGSGKEFEMVEYLKKNKIFKFLPEILKSFSIERAQEIVECIDLMEESDLTEIKKKFHRGKIFKILKSFPKKQ